MPFDVFLMVLLSVTMHAAWNFLSKKHTPSAAFFCIASFAAGVCWIWAIPAAGMPEKIMNLTGVSLILLSLLFETCYFTGLFNAYAASDMSLAYPVARALPVLLITGITAIIYPGRYPDLWGMTGLLLVFAGCLLMPLKRFRDFSYRNYIDPAMRYILLAAAGTSGYTLVDAELMKLMSTSPGHSGMSAAYVFSFIINTALGFSLGLIVLLRKKEQLRFRECFAGWKNLWPPVTAGVLSSLAYLLILAAMPRVTFLSFLQAFRQMSLPIGLLLGIIILKEPAHKPKLAGICAIVCGLAVIAFPAPNCFIAATEKAEILLKEALHCLF